MEQQKGTVPPRPKPQVRFFDQLPKGEKDKQAPPLPFSLSGLESLDSREYLVPDISLRWTPIASIAAHFPQYAWTSVMRELVLHPERNSSSILRAEILSTETGESESSGEEARAQQNSLSRSTEQWRTEERIERRLLPRQIGLDWPLRQGCSFYTHVRCNTSEAESASSTLLGGAVVYTALLDEEKANDSASQSVVSSRLALPSSPSQIPFYHPRVRAIGFRYIAPESNESHDDALPPSSLASPPKVYGELRIEIVRFPAGEDDSKTQEPTELPPIGKRLRQTAQRLLQTAHQHSWGTWHGYVPRVEHDVLVPKELYQDTYLALKRRHAALLVKEWKESTDPSKHVFEELGIAAWLMCLWKEMYQARQLARPSTVDEGEGEGPRPWALWGESTGGFVDVGCGNGMLVHVLNAEGYKGYGFDLRARKSWPGWASHGADLRLQSLDAPKMVIASLSPRSVLSPRSPANRTIDSFPNGSFLIGNHADELTPWMPLLAAATPNAAFVSIACCPWDVNGKKFTRTKYEIVGTGVRALLGLSLPSSDSEGDSEPSSTTASALLSSTMSALERGPSDPQVGIAGTHSRNAAYLSYLGDLHLRAGWHVEKEALRIPSTRNWALVGRRRTWETLPGVDEGDAMRGRKVGCKSWERTMREQIEGRVREMAISAAPHWIPRLPEGNAGSGAESRH